MMFRRTIECCNQLGNLGTSLSNYYEKMGNDRLTWHPWRTKRRGTPGLNVWRQSWGAQAGAPPQAFTERHCPVRRWEARCSKALWMCISTFHLRFSSLNLLNFHGSFIKNVESLIYSTPNSLESRIQSTKASYKQFNQDFDNCSSKYQCSSCNLL